MPTETIAGLLSDTSYEIWVAATNTAGSGPDSEILVVKTKPTLDSFSVDFSEVFK